MSIINHQKRALTTKLGMGILPIKIETDRIINMPLEERICELCRMNEIEDEEHFLCKCPVYDDLRYSLYRRAQDVCFDFNTYTSEEKLISLMKYVWRDVSTYIVNAWNRRKIFCITEVGWQKQRMP